MKKIVFAATFLLALAASGSASAQQVVATAPTGGCATCNQQGQPATGYPQGYADPGYGYGYGIGHGFGHPMYGVNPAFSRIFGHHKNMIDRIAFGKGHGNGFGHGGGQPQMGPTIEAAQGGTLVFPQNPYIRSPRDFFMWEPK